MPSPARSARDFGETPGQYLPRRSLRKYIVLNPCFYDSEENFCHLREDVYREDGLLLPAHGSRQEEANAVDPFIVLAAL